MPIDLIDQARRYLDKIEPAVSGNGGHDKTYHVAAILIEGFGLSVTDATPLMAEYSQRCQPPWSEREIAHKLESAAARIDPAKHRKLVRNGVRYAARSNTPAVRITRTKPSLSLSQHAMRSAMPWRCPILLKMVVVSFYQRFSVKVKESELPLLELVMMAAKMPKDAGVTLSREEWLRKLDQHDGDPNRFLKTSDRNGLFVSVNPMKIGGSKDSDVTAFRHALLEFDNISQIEQWGIIQASRIPCSAVISSGGKSIHAWVKVDAADGKEFDETG
jgi:hypothetical protein